jgi:hypothetical protein
MGQALGAESFTSFFLVLTSRARWQHSSFPGHTRVSFLTRARGTDSSPTLECLPRWSVCHIFIRIADAPRHEASYENITQDHGSLGHHLRSQGDGVAKLLQPMDMVPLDARFIQLGKVIGSQIGIRLLRP